MKLSNLKTDEWYSFLLKKLDSAADQSTSGPGDHAVPVLEQQKSILFANFYYFI